MCGRLGNQLFQYSFARKIQETTGQDITIDFTAINQVNNPEWRDYLQYYNCGDYNVVSNKEYYPIQRFIYKVLKLMRPKNERKQYVFDKITARVFAKLGVIYLETDYKALNISKIYAKNIVIRGWFESSKYFCGMEDILHKEFKPKEPLSYNNQLLLEQLKNSNSICLTIRRGNFTDTELKDKFLVCTPEYYYSAISYIKSKHPQSVIYVCSDDIE